MYSNMKVQRCRERCVQHINHILFIGTPSKGIVPIKFSQTQKYIMDQSRVFKY